MLQKKKNPFAMPSMVQESQDDDSDDTEDTDGEDGTDTEIDPSEEDDSDEQTEGQPSPVIPKPSGSRFQQIFGQASAQPPGPRSAAFSNFLDQPPPEQKDFQPGKMNRLSAILGGASEGYFKGAGAGIKTAKEVLGDPYKQAMNKYALTGKNLEQGAEIESKNLGRAASFARTAGNMDTADKKAENEKLKIEAQNRHWTAQDLKTANTASQKGWTHYTNPDGHLIFTRPGTDGKLESIDGGKSGESIPEKSKRILEEAQKKEDIKIKGSKDVNQDKAALDQIRDNKRGAIQQQLAGDRGDQQRKTNEEKPKTPRQQHEEIQLRLKKIVAANGDKVKDFINADGTGLSGPPTKGMMESDKEFKKRLAQYHQVYTAVYGDDE